MAYAVLVNVTFTDDEAAKAALEPVVIPQTKSQAGFQTGYWCHGGDGTGMSFQVYDTKANADEAAAAAKTAPPIVVIDSVKVFEVRGQA